MLFSHDVFGFVDEMCLECLLDNIRNNFRFSFHENTAEDIMKTIGVVYAKEYQ
jgi:hypothetical protein